MAKYNTEPLAQLLAAKRHASEVQAALHAAMIAAQELRRDFEQKAAELRSLTA